jgi:hypothetical protein
MRGFATGCVVVLVGAVSTPASALEFWERLEPDQVIQREGAVASELILLDAGDIDGDGYADLASAWSGRLRIYRGGAEGLALAWSENVTADSPLAAGDVSGDGHSDLLVQASDGSWQVWRGGVAGPDTEGAWTLAAGDALSLGSAGTIAGDVNADGYDDLVVGAEAGGFALFLGGAAGPSYGGWQQAHHRTADQLQPAGDVDGDGYEDLLLRVDNSAIVYFGAAAGFRAEVVAVELDLGMEPYYGFPSVGGTDLDGDGLPELVTRDQEALLARVFSNEGGAYSAANSTTLKGSGLAFGSSLGVGDLSGDGYAELVAGVPGDGGGRGQVHVFAGGPDGLGAHGLTALAGEPGEQLGVAVLVAGDLNGDGYRDLVATAGGVELWIFHGGPGLGGAR